MEYITARDSGAVQLARRSGTVDYVDSQRIVVRVEGETEATSREMGADIYPMTKSMTRPSFTFRYGDSMKPNSLMRA